MSDGSARGAATTVGHPTCRRRQSGSALLAVILLAGATAAMALALLGDAATLTAETRAHRDAQCARYAALGGLAAGTAASGRPSLVDDRVTALRVERVLLRPNWCVLRATAACGNATRTLEHTLPDPAACR